MSVAGGGSSLERGQKGARVAPPSTFRSVPYSTVAYVYSQLEAGLYFCFTTVPLLSAYHHEKMLALPVPSAQMHLTYG